MGGAYVHSSKSGVTHFMCDTEEETLMSIRELLSFLPSNNMEDAPSVACSDDVRREVEALQEVIPDDPNVPYDMKDVIEPVVDNHYFFEVMPHFAKNVVVGFARLGGQSVGIVAISRLSWQVCWISMHRTRQPVSSVFVIASISRS